MDSRRRSRVWAGPGGLLVAAVILCGLGLHAADTERQQAGIPGEPVHARTVSVLRPGAAGPTPLDLGAILGKRPLVVCYFTPGEPLGEEQLRLVQERARGAWAGKVEVLAAIRFGASGAA